MRILFVDDEPKVLEGLRRMLRPMRREWEMHFAASGEEALQEMAQQDFQVVVSDMRMPGMDGAELLRRVRREHPDVVRIVLSGHSDMESILRAVGPSHQYLTKPCDADTIRETIARAVALESLLRNETLRKLVGHLKSVPSMPALYKDLVEALRAPDASLRDIGQIIATDVGMTAQVLRLVNSSYFGLFSEVTSAERAVGFLGLGTVNSLVLGFKVFEELDPKTLEELGLASVWQRSLACAMNARRIAQLESGDSRLPEDAFAGGMVHDVGILVLASNMPQDYAQICTRARRGKIPLHLAEREALGVGHPEVGAYLMSLWGIPNPVIEAIAYHHAPRDCHHESLSPLSAVHAAGALVSEDTPENAFLGVRADMDYLGKLGLAERLDTWRQECGAPAAPAEVR